MDDDEITIWKHDYEVETKTTRHLERIGTRLDELLHETADGQTAETIDGMAFDLEVCCDAYRIVTMFAARVMGEYFDIGEASDRLVEADHDAMLLFLAREQSTDYALADSYQKGLEEGKKRARDSLIHVKTLFLQEAPNAEAQTFFQKGAEAMLEEVFKRLSPAKPKFDIFEGNASEEDLACLKEEDPDIEPDEQAGGDDTGDKGEAT